MTSSQTTGFYRIVLVAVLAVMGFSAHTAFAADATLGVTQVTPVQTAATADDTFEHGWSWLFDVTVPADETLLQLKASDWTSAAGTMPTAGNVRFYSAQSLDAADAAHALTLAQADAYGTTVMHLDDNQDFDLTKAGRQIQVMVEAKVPTGTANGSYSTSYGIDTEHDPANGPQLSRIAVSEDASDPAAGSIIVNPTDVTHGVSVFAFNLQNNDLDAKVDSLVIRVARSAGMVPLSTIISAATLTVNGQHFAGQVSSTDNAITFSTGSFTIPSHGTDVGTLTVDFAPQEGRYRLGRSLTFSLAAEDIHAQELENAERIPASDISGTATGKAHVLASAHAELAADSTSSVVQVSDTDPSQSYGTFTMKFDVTAVGGDVFVPRTAQPATGSTAYVGAVYSVQGDTTGANVTESLTSTADITGAFYEVPEGSTRAFTLTVAIDPAAAGMYAVGLSAVQYSLDMLVSDLQALPIAGDDASFEAPPVFIAN